MFLTARQLALIDVGLIVLLSVAYVVAEALNVPKRWTFLGVAVALILFSIWLAHRHTDTLRDLGLRFDNLRIALIPIGLGRLIAVATVMTWAVATGQSLWRRDMLLLLPIYPLWGVAQQTIFQGIFHRRLMSLAHGPVLPIVATALLFSAVHFGNLKLMGLTFIGGLLWSTAFRRWPNTMALGLSHGILAAVIYPIVLQDAPISRI